MIGIVFTFVLKFLILKHRQQEIASKVQSIGGFVEVFGAFGEPEILRFDVSIKSDGKRISDSDGKYIKTLTGVRGIVLDYTSIGDKMLEHLAQLEGLEFVCAERTNVTSNGVKNLQSRLPDCQIYWDKNLATFWFSRSSLREQQTKQ